MRGILKLLCAALIFHHIIQPVAAQQNLTSASVSHPPIPARFKPVAREVVAKRLQKPLDNISGAIAWGASYELDALLAMYEATHDTEYLDLFVKLANAVVAARADVAGVRDWKNELRRGWPTGGHYTLGVPQILPDKNGQPALEIQTVARSGNNETTIEIAPDANGTTFSLIAANSFRKTTPETVRFTDLTMENVEARANVSSRPLVRVRKLGTSIPAARAPFTPPTSLVVLHGHHTGQIVAPLACFAVLVQKAQREKLPLERYENAASKYLHSAETALSDMEQDWREQDDFGYFIFEKGIPFWSDGVPEPLNTLAATGIAYLHLWDATAKPIYRERATKLARLVQRELLPQPGGTVNYHYWWGIVRSGWKAQDNISVNTPVYPGQDVVEDQSHFQLSLRFILEAFHRGIVFSRTDLERLARTFHQKIHRLDEKKNGSLSDRVDGSGKNTGTYDYALSGWAQMGKIDPKIPVAARAIMERKFAPITPRSVTLYAWAALARDEAAKR